MVRKTFKIIISVLAACLFLWLALRNVDLRELWGQVAGVRLWWVFPFTFVMLVSHFLRGERWGLFLSDLELKPARSTLFAGVMIGYIMNNIFPRLGEVSRPVYVARSLGVSTGSLLGTIILERMIDLVCLVGVLVFITVYFVADPELISQIFGTGEWAGMLFIGVPLMLVLIGLMAWAAYRLLRYLEGREDIRSGWLVRAIDFSNMFLKGLVSIRTVRNWPLFMLYTAGIWIGYIIMAYLPFHMLDLHLMYDLGFAEAMIVMVISAVGITVPTPGGIGSYHLFVQQSLWILFEVPLVIALTYATVTHAVTILLIFITGAGVLWFDKYYTLKNKIIR